MKTIIALLILLILQACSSQAAPMASNEDLLYQEGDRVCLTTGSSNQTVTLLDDVRLEQNTVLAELRDGRTRMVDVVYLSEQINCGRD